MVATAVVVAVCLVSGGARAETFTLVDALAVAYETNPALDSARAGQRATDEDVAQANANWRPQVNVSGSYGYEGIHGGLGIPGTYPLHPLTTQVTVAEPVFRGGRTYAEVGKAKATVRAGRAQLVNTEQSVLFDAVSAYMDVVRDEATLKLRQNNVAVLQKQLDATQEQFRVGELTRTDVAQSQARLAGAQADLVTAQGQLAVSRSNFEHVIGRPAETLEDQPAFPRLPSSQDTAVQIATNQNPALIQAREEAKAADYAVDDALGALLPQVSVNGQYQYSQGSITGFSIGTQHITSLLGEVTVPIYQGGAEESAVRQAKQQRGQAQLAIADTQRQVEDATRTAWQAYVTAEATIKSNKAQVAANEVAFDGVKQEQQVGSRTILDVLNAEQELLNAEVAVVSSQRDSYVAAYQLLGAMGLLTARNLALQVKLYDPVENYNDNASRWFGLGD
ncbi:MAG: TolC family outer membrane protein [Rhizomicrobium sp.]